MNNDEQKIKQFNDILASLGLPEVTLEKQKMEKMTNQNHALNSVRNGGFIICSIDKSGNLSFALNPIVHSDANAARAECRRLAGINRGKAFIFVKLSGAELVPDTAISI